MALENDAVFVQRRVERVQFGKLFAQFRAIHSVKLVSCRRQGRWRGVPDVLRLSTMSRGVSGALSSFVFVSFSLLPPFCFFALHIQRFGLL